MAVLSFTTNCSSHALASQDLLRPWTPRLLMDALKTSCMPCAMQGMWFPKAGHAIPEASIVAYRSRVIEYVTAQEGTEILGNNRRKIRKVWKELYHGKAETLEDTEEAARWWRYDLIR